MGEFVAAKDQGPFGLQTSRKRSYLWCKRNSL